MNIASLYALFQSNPLISTDTRAITKDSLFFALKGQTFNGNTFAAQALSLGAKYVIIDEPQAEMDERYILVDDVLKTLQDLASYYRQQLQIPVIGITGTNGKTTTKELLQSVLAQKYQVFATKGNLNNHIGVPLSVLSIGSDIEIAIIEMGANHVGEIAFLCQIAQPSAGLITNVGKAHLEGFGSFEGVKRAKGELYAYLSQHGGHLFIQADNPHLKEMATMQTFASISRYGFYEDLEIHGQLNQADPFLSLQWQKKGDLPQSITLQMTGSYNVENVLAAAAVGVYYGLENAQINAGLVSYQPANQRSQIVQTDKGNTLICDYYNANASSMQAALTNLDDMKASQKVLILGDMFELGEDSLPEHLSLIQKAQSLAVDRCIFVGKAFYAVGQGHAECYASTEEAISALCQQPVTNALVLVKASRGMKFEHLIPVL
jgi:UDP-N-acetylmuramoyl-tripeptide--D-alanyl-D-alanine ligase